MCQKVTSTLVCVCSQRDSINCRHLLCLNHNAQPGAIDRSNRFYQRKRGEPQRAPNWVVTKWEPCAAYISIKMSVVNPVSGRVDTKDCNDCQERYEENDYETVEEWICHDCKKHHAPPGQQQHRPEAPHSGPSGGSSSSSRAGPSTLQGQQGQHHQQHGVPDRVVAPAIPIAAPAADVAAVPGTVFSAVLTVALHTALHAASRATAVAVHLFTVPWAIFAAGPAVDVAAAPGSIFTAALPPNYATVASTVLAAAVAIAVVVAALPAVNPGILGGIISAGLAVFWFSW
ncbi:hypothetical protein B0H63DRAFT_527563 [Podospora didyma]|uniref:Uncharacterized protein n=1 Tax=Podospora didyma TaxID=330526 RepID=A0AAE0N7X6_9PEZI|nr:hypothetical protein B0H63DRAFT_527563 [Podospora didyma]